MGQALIAHVRRNDDGTWAEPHGLLQHLKGTAELAQKYAAKFDSGTWGRVAGLAHDAGKGREVWQQYLHYKSEYDEEAHLEGKKGKILHAIFGAKLAEDLFGKGIGRILAYCIAGHHAGLPDWSNAEGAGQSSLEYQEAQVRGLKEIDPDVIDLIRSSQVAAPPWKFNLGLDLSLWIRMLYSSLVDADFLDTECYMDPDKANCRGTYCTMPELLARFRRFSEQMDKESAVTKINALRRDIRRHCIQMAQEEQGIFSLSVPTGGGKTLSSLAFGLEHAIKHGLDRIIYVIPYTSIIEQNADVFRQVLGKDQVVEHHSSLDEEETSAELRLAAENWDAPVIVTTSVQFFESLFAAKSSRCRKLHNIAGSVVILDEAQLMPVEFLGPILETIQLLTDHYRVSFVISTATQPAFSERLTNGKRFPGLKHIREIMGDEPRIKRLYASLHRCRIQFPADLHTVSSWEDIARELKQHEQVLCIVSDRKSCRELYKLMPAGTFHLSALMCGQHRSKTIQAIKEKLQNGEPVRVISTQLVEAGVDLDFPVVYRALAGLDSIIQAAGRCNREGKLPELGQVVVFVPPRKPPAGILRQAAETTCGILAGCSDPIQHDNFEKYFSELYWKAQSWDKENIVDLLDPQKNDPRECSIYFRTAAEKFRIIDDSTKTVFVPYAEGRDLIAILKAKGPDRWLMRKLQRYAVSVYEDDFHQMVRRSAVEEIYPQIFALVLEGDYSEEVGLMPDNNFDPDRYMY